MESAVLIVEDEKNIASLLGDRLQEEGYQVRVAYTGADALKQLKEKSPDVITLDIYLPDANGLTLLKDIKANPEMKKIPVIIISSSDDEGDGVKTLGAEGFFRKPVDFTKLFDMLKTLKTKNP
ncbi:MAG: response regulator [Endomicrobiales bacterium]|jgi:DNA-binding response OmpR family regulator